MLEGLEQRLHVEEGGLEVERLQGRVDERDESAFDMQGHEALDPVGTGFFGEEGIAPETYGIADAIQETFEAVLHCSP